MRPGPATTSSETTTHPASGCSKPAIIRSSVVLPQPDGPSTARSSPGSMSRFSSRTALTEPNDFDSPRIRTWLMRAPPRARRPSRTAAGEASTSLAPMRPDSRIIIATGSSPTSTIISAGSAAVL